MMSLDSTEMIISAIIGALGIAGYFLGVFRWIRQIVTRLGGADYSFAIKVPSKTITIVQRAHPKTPWWHMGKSGDQPAMQIVAEFTVSNLTKLGIMLPVAKLKKPKLLGHCIVCDVETDVYGSKYIIPPGTTTEVHCDFWLVPPIKKESDTFRADVALVDQFGNDHWVKDVEFTYR
jgi:hypothetical protein